MLKFRLAPIVAIALSAAISLAQEPATSAESKPDAPKVNTVSSKPAPVKPSPVHQRSRISKATPVPVATPIPKKPGFWERVFGKKKPTPAPATPTPKPVYKKKPVSKVRKPKPEVSATQPANATAEQPGSENAVVEPPKTEEQPKPPVRKGSDNKKTAKRGQDFPPSTDNADAEIVEKQKYDQARAKAIADPKIQELRGKADLAASEDESRKALRAYNRAMFKRMKEIDPSIKDHIDSMEAAVMSRLGE
jgi:hypothetical protein